MANPTEMTVRGHNTSVSISNPKDLNVPGFDTERADIVDWDKDRDVDYVVLTGKDLGEDKIFWVFPDKDSYASFCSREEIRGGGCDFPKQVVYRADLIKNATHKLFLHYKKAANFLQNTLPKLLKESCRSEKLEIDEGDDGRIRLKYNGEKEFKYIHYFSSDDTNVYLEGIKQFLEKCSEK